MKTSRTFNGFGQSYIDWKPKTQPPVVAKADVSPSSKERRREIMDRDKVWVSDPLDGFVLGQIVDLTDEGALVQPLDKSRPAVEASFDRLYPAEDDPAKDVDDNCGLMYLNEATLLENVRLRYAKDKIYTYVANILIAVNPYSDIANLYGPAAIKAYRGKSLGVQPPHVFAIADKAFRDMKVVKQSQSIIVSGESGSGKTESTKYILKYLCDNFGTSQGGLLEQKILNANPVLEAFGNAKTTRNNNSSRFGKFIEIHFDARCQVVGGYISHYLLERARVTAQSPGERNYHIFYQLCAGAPDSLAEKLRLGPPDSFRYLSRGCNRYFLSKESGKKVGRSRLSAEEAKSGPMSDALIDDYANFKTVDKDLQNLGMGDAERLSVYATIAAVLHLGNVVFEDDPDDNRGGCRVTDSSEESLRTTASLMGLDADELRRALTARVMQASKGGTKGTVIMVPLKVHEASSARDALAKAVYSKLFDHVVGCINRSIPFSESAYYIGVLDIAGFEYFTVNSFEQFCINYCNEKLQQFFNRRILKDEQELYGREGLGVKRIGFVDNQDCIDLLESRGAGIFALLDEESKLPKPSHQHFTEAVHGHNGSHFRLALPRKSKLREHREIRDDDGFLIRHFAGAVCYTTAQFIDKNNDALHASLEALVHESRNDFVGRLFAQAATHDGSAAAKPSKGKLTFVSVGNKFQKQLQDLMEKLRSTGTNFVRCIKPNVEMVPHLFEGASILSQLQCAGMTAVLELMQQGYPSRTAFADLYGAYRQHMPPELARLDPRFFCKALFRALGLDDNDFKFGLTKVFFRPGKFAEFDQMLRNDPENLRRLVAKVKTWILRSRWKKAQWCALSAIKLANKIVYRRAALVTVQKSVRMFVARRRHAPRYLGIMQLRRLDKDIDALGQLTAPLKKDAKASVSANIAKIRSDLDSAIAQIRASTSIRKPAIDATSDRLTERIRREMGDVKAKLERQKAAEEQERLRRIQEEMELERKRKAEEEQRQARMEEEHRAKAAIEERRRAEEALISKHLESDRKAAQAIQDRLNEENRKLKEQIEQERRDHELALRLARENNSAVEDLASPPTLIRSASIPTAAAPAAPSKLKAKQDLSNWKYAELRDTINTSCDIDLLEACREEFHRRLKVYHSWKSKNRKAKTTTTPAADNAMRAPQSVMAAAESSSQTGAIQKRSGKSAGVNKAQRYFRIPFSKPSDGHNGLASPTHASNKGWWYAHFDGDWIARQMELHPDHKPVLLVAGKDDMQMCELSLAETKLTLKQGAEILEGQFEQAWNANGGRAYVRRSS